MPPDTALRILAGLGQGVNAIAAGRERSRALQAASGMFRELGTPQSGIVADLLERDPDAALAFAQEFGGFDRLYDSIAQSAFASERLAITREAAMAKAAEKERRGDVLAGVLRELPDEPTFGEMKEAAAEVADQNAGFDDFVSILSRAPKAPKAGALTERERRARAISSFLQATGIKASDWTPPSLNAFVRTFFETNEIDRSLLVPAADAKPEGGPGIGRRWVPRAGYEDEVTQESVPPGWVSMAVTEEAEQVDERVRMTGQLRSGAVDAMTREEKEVWARQFAAVSGKTVEQARQIAGLPPADKGARLLEQLMQGGASPFGSAPSGQEPE